MWGQSPCAALSLQVLRDALKRLVTPSARRSVPLSPPLSPTLDVTNHLKFMIKTGEQWHLVSVHIPLPTNSLGSWQRSCFPIKHMLPRLFGVWASHPSRWKAAAPPGLPPNSSATLCFCLCILNICAEPLFLCPQHSPVTPWSGRKGRLPAVSCGEEADRKPCPGTFAWG